MDVTTTQILLIEDDPDYTFLIQELLADGFGPSHHLRLAENLEKGLERLTDEQVDVVLLDLGLPDSLGLETLERVRTHDQEAAVVVLTGLDDGEIATKAVQAGAQDYLVKGQFDGHLLARTIRYSIERNRLQGELRGAEERLRKIVMNNADGIVVLDPMGVVRFLNPAAQALLGDEEDELLGQSFGFRVSAGETSEINIARASGEARVAEMRIVETLWDGENCCLASLRDVTERKRMEEALRVRSDRQEALRKVNRDITKKLDLDTLFSRICRSVSVLLDVEITYLLLLDKNTGAFDVVSAFGEAEGERMPVRTVPPGKGIAGRIVSEKGPVGVVEVLKDSDFLNHEWAERTGIQSFLGIPLLLEDQVAGMLICFVKRVRNFQPDEIELLTDFAGQAAIALDNARARSPLRWALRRASSTEGR